jgi:ABC-type glycerol-3-phosphate transport system substrate-binding protein
MGSRMIRLAAATALTALAAACGGGGKDDVDESAVPDAAVQSSEAFTQFVREREASETREALTMNGAMPPTSETDEPIDID